ncbi:hypothetical protein ACFL2J_06880 [Candidatus Omnitrophota bacterium]
MNPNTYVAIASLIAFIVFGVISHRRIKKLEINQKQYIKVNQLNQNNADIIIQIVEQKPNPAPKDIGVILEKAKIISSTSQNALAVNAESVGIDAEVQEFIPENDKYKVDFVPKDKEDKKISKRWL